ncbi:diamine N-acetyltransferase [Anaerolineales bacterium]|nr:diamine N-acetyltransferase [Anaerolineales bacterium]
MTSDIRRLTEDDLPRLREFWTENWGADFMVLHGESIRFDQVEGFIFGDWDGLLTFQIRGDECEIVSLDSLKEGQGIGTALIESVVEEAKSRKCCRLFLVTTNDNLHALGFYQRRGFELVAIHRGAVNKSRKIKPSIPLIGENGIPLRDEIELEMMI